MQKKRQENNPGPTLKEMVEDKLKFLNPRNKNIKRLYLVLADASNTDPMVHEEFAKRLKYPIATHVVKALDKAINIGSMLPMNDLYTSLNELYDSAYNYTKSIEEWLFNPANSADFNLLDLDVIKSPSQLKAIVPPDPSKTSEENIPGKDAKESIDNSNIGGALMIDEMNANGFDMLNSNPDLKAYLEVSTKMFLALSIEDMITIIFRDIDREDADGAWIRGQFAIKASMESIILGYFLKKNFMFFFNVDFLTIDKLLTKIQKGASFSEEGINIRNNELKGRTITELLTSSRSTIGELITLPTYVKSTSSTPKKKNLYSKDSVVRTQKYIYYICLNKCALVEDPNDKKVLLNTDSAGNVTEPAAERPITYKNGDIVKIKNQYHYKWIVEDKEDPTSPDAPGMSANPPEEKPDAVPYNEKDPIYEAGAVVIKDDVYYTCKKDTFTAPPVTDTVMLKPGYKDDKGNDLLGPSEDGENEYWKWEQPPIVSLHNEKFWKKAKFPFDLLKYTDTNLPENLKVTPSTSWLRVDKINKDETIIIYRYVLGYLHDILNNVVKENFKAAKVSLNDLLDRALEDMKAKKVVTFGEYSDKCYLLLQEFNKMIQDLKFELDDVNNIDFFRALRESSNDIFRKVDSIIKSRQVIDRKADPVKQNAIKSLLKLSASLNNSGKTGSDLKNMINSELNNIQKTVEIEKKDLYDLSQVDAALKQFGVDTDQYNSMDYYKKLSDRMNSVKPDNYYDFNVDNPPFEVWQSIANEWGTSLGLYYRWRGDYKLPPDPEPPDLDTYLIYTEDVGHVGYEEDENGVVIWHGEDEEE